MRGHGKLTKIMLGVSLLRSTGKEKVLMRIGHDEIKPISQVPSDPFNGYVISLNARQANID